MAARVMLWGCAVIVALGVGFVRYQGIAREVVMDAIPSLTERVTSLLHQNELETFPTEWDANTLRGRIVKFRRPGCARTSLAVPARVSWNVDTFADRVAPENTQRAYFYQSARFDKAERFNVIARASRSALIAGFGLERSRYIPDRFMLVLVEPMECAVADDPVAWTTLWRTDALPPDIFNRNTDQEQL